MLGMSDMWRNGRLPRVEDWFAPHAGPRYLQSALLDWIPEALRDELAANGRKIMAGRATHPAAA